MELSRALACCSKCNIHMHVKCILGSGVPLDCLLDSPINRKYFNGNELQMLVTQLQNNDGDESQCLKVMLSTLQERRVLFYLCNKCLSGFGIG